MKMHQSKNKNSRSFLEFLNNPEYNAGNYNIGFLDIFNLQKEIA